MDEQVESALLAGPRSLSDEDLLAYARAIGVAHGDDRDAEVVGRLHHHFLQVSA